MQAELESGPVLFVRAGTARPGSSAWLVTFGDLLTLLVCFFITIISHSTFNPADGVAEGVKADSGTAIAILPVETPDSLELSLRFRERDFRANGVRMQVSARRRLKKAVNLEGYALTNGVIESCAKAADHNEEGNWALSVRRAFSLRSQVIDAGLTAEGVALRFLGESCGLLKPAGSRALMRLNLAKIEAGA